MKSILLTLSLCILSSLSFAAPDDTSDDFIDSPLSSALSHPSWFKKSSGDLRDDLKSAIKSEKTGLILYFGQEHCPYCEQFIKKSLGLYDIERTVRENYDVIKIDIWSSEDIINIDGKEYTERDLATFYNTDFTPSVVFIDRAGTPIFRLRGYYSPYKFRAALKYIGEGFYINETFRAYLARAEVGLFFLEKGLNERDFFMLPPYDLNTIIKKHKRPIMVSFEQGDCHACDLLHSSPLNKEETINELKKIDSVQLNMWSDTPVITPEGTKTTAIEWATKLNLFHSPTLIFFDADGKEIIRIDSVVKFYRLLNVLKYINQRGYLTEKNLQRWLLKQRKIK